LAVNLSLDFSGIKTYHRRTMTVLEYISDVIAVIGAAIIVWGVINGLVALLVAEFYRLRAGGKKTIKSEERVRLGIGFNLVLGLEFLIAADIIRTIIEPTLEDLAILGSIVAIRIALAYFLGREIGLPGRRS
jgi:uncharacterized membrane protein